MNGLKWVIGAVSSILVALASGQPALAVVSAKGSPVDSRGSTVLDANEETHLVFMREEEKLARDVYITLGLRFPELEIFGRIDDAEQRHTCSVCDVLKKYGIEDPSTNDNVGVYTGELYGPYFTQKYAELVERGSRSPLDALYVGAYIEELDMIDINYCPEEIIELNTRIRTSSDCGKIYTDNPDIQRLYTSLLEGSESHLRAFVENIERRIGEGAYQAQVLPQDEVDEILER